MDNLTGTTRDEIIVYSSTRDLKIPQVPSNIDRYRDFRIKTSFLLDAIGNDYPWKWLNKKEK
jgi:hypothetical protein